MLWGYYKYIVFSVLRLPNEFWNSNWFLFAKVCFKIYIGSICLEMCASPSQDMKGDIYCSIFVVVGIWSKAGVWIAVRVCGLDYSLLKRMWNITKYYRYKLNMFTLKKTTYFARIHINNNKNVHWLNSEIISGHLKKGIWF